MNAEIEPVARNLCLIPFTKRQGSLGVKRPLIHFLAGRAQSLALLATSSVTKVKLLNCLKP